jgi:hypothetical protein
MASTEVRIGDFRVLNSGTQLMEPSGSAPSAPTGLTIKVRGKTLVLAWTAVSGATSYNVKRSLTAAGTTTTFSASNNYYNDSAVKDVRYFYVVTAVNTYGESSASAQVFASTRRG